MDCACWITRYFEWALKAAITLPFGDDYFVKAEDFVTAFKVVLQSKEGTAIRERLEKYKTSIGAELVAGGSTYAAIIEFANLVKRGSAST